MIFINLYFKNKNNIKGCIIIKLIINQAPNTLKIEKKTSELNSKNLYISNFKK